MKKTSRGLHELYAEDPMKADELLWGRRGRGRRGFIKRSSLVLLGTVLGAEMVFAKNFPRGLIPAALADSDIPFQLPGKHPGLVVLNDRPINAETPPHLLDDPVTGADVLFVRNNGIPPERDTIDPSSWQLTVGGESVTREVTLSLSELKEKFTHYTYQLTIECGGNGRSEFQPPAKGNQWTTGAVGCPEWTGVRLRDVLEYAGIKPDAVYIGYTGADTHLSGQPGKLAISRGVPMQKAMEDESLIAWAINGQDLPLLNGYPLRLVFGGWPASCSGKWLTRIDIRNKIHDGEKMGGQSYRIPCEPVAPGTLVPDDDMCIIESMPVKSLITYPRTAAEIESGKTLPVRGHAWAGDLSVQSVDISIDFGASWVPATLAPPANRLAWQRFEAQVQFPQTGYYEVWARATDENGVQQPMLVPGWNPKGYLNNACHRIAIRVS